MRGIEKRACDDQRGVIDADRGSDAGFLLGSAAAR
jgi:hypothetical protein